MDYQYLASNLLIQIVFFISWSFILFAIAKAVAKFLPQLVRWSRFWQAWLVIALVPLLPTAFSSMNHLIPNALKNAFGGSQDKLLMHSNAVVSQLGNKIELQLVQFIIVTLLILGSSYSILRFFLGLIKVNTLIRQATSLQDFTDINQEQRNKLTANNIRVLTTNQSISPLVFGFFSVNLLLPESVFTMPAQQRFLLIEHELMHIQRQDPKAVILFRLCSCLFWFNPFIIYFERHFLKSMELNCDMAVISSFPDAKLHYAQALITSLKLSKNTLDNGVTTYFSSPSFNKKDFEDRIKAAMSTQLNSHYGVKSALALISLSSLTVSFALLAKPLLPQQMFTANYDSGQAPVLNAKISSAYDEINAFRGVKPHKGIDFSAAIGTDVVASFSGQVIIADDTTLHQNYGKVVLIEHKGKIQSLYAHLNTFSVKSGEYISVGQKLGTVGETGRTTGPHLHFEILKEGKRADPHLYLDL